MQGATEMQLTLGLTRERRSVSKSRAVSIMAIVLRLDGDPE